MRTVAILYCDPKGVYPSMPAVDCWDEARDARLYDGPHPVIAHPPCGSYGSLRHLYQRDDADCALRAVEQGRAFGGVLEHPAHSELWKRASLPSPLHDWGTEGLPQIIDAHAGFSLEVEQVSWGHVARKKTWLYLRGIDRNEAVRGVRYGGPPTPARYRQSACPAPPAIKVCSAQHRRRTPPLFAEWLVSLARGVRQ